MSAPVADDVSVLLRAWQDGDQAAFDQLVPLVFDELHRLAHRYMRHQQADHILQTTALVNEAYLRLIGAGDVAWKDRAHFYAISANLMRHILVDFERSRRYKKRGGDLKQVALDERTLPSPMPDPDLIQLNDALDILAQLDPRKAKVVELRFFGGLDLDETAEVLHVSRDTVKRDWKFAKVWLLCELKDRERDEAGELAGN
jgi:RNA polymerase sigma factor (TIGR02999 family)